MFVQPLVEGLGHGLKIEFAEKVAVDAVGRGGVEFGAAFAPEANGSTLGLAKALACAAEFADVDGST